MKIIISYSPTIVSHGDGEDKKKWHQNREQVVPWPLVWFQSRPGSCWQRGHPPWRQGLDCTCRWTSNDLRTCWGSLPAAWGPNPVWEKEEKTEVSDSFRLGNREIHESIISGKWSDWVYKTSTVLWLRSGLRPESFFYTCSAGGKV